MLCVFASLLLNYINDSLSFSLTLQMKIRNEQLTKLNLNCVLQKKISEKQQQDHHQHQEKKSARVRA